MAFGTSTMVAVLGLALELGTKSNRGGVGDRLGGGGGVATFGGGGGVGGLEISGGGGDGVGILFEEGMFRGGDEALSCVIGFINGKGAGPVFVVLRSSTQSSQSSSQSSSSL